jgi:L-fuculose-phosphate aldolase
MDKELRLIGRVRTPRPSTGEPSGHPHKLSDDSIEAVISVDPEYAEALAGLKVGQEASILTWRLPADRSRLTFRPVDDPDSPLQGVFTSRTPDRPNPIGFSRVRILAVEEGRELRVSGLHVADMTPVLDIQPLTETKSDTDPETGSETPSWGQGVPPEAAEELREVCRRAHAAGLMPGTSGDASVRLGNVIVITAPGAIKADLRPGDLTPLDLRTGKRLGPGRSSAEAPMHLELYDAQPQAWTVLHLHPPHLTALTLDRARSRDDDLRLPSSTWASHLSDRLTSVEDHPPGTPALFGAVAKTARDFQALSLSGDGLVCWAEEPRQALALAEELESLARIRLLAPQACAEDHVPDTGSPEKTD